MSRGTPCRTLRLFNDDKNVVDYNGSMRLALMLQTLLNGPGVDQFCAPSDIPISRQSRSHLLASDGSFDLVRLVSLMVRNDSSCSCPSQYLSSSLDGQSCPAHEEEVTQWQEFIVFINTTQGLTRNRDGVLSESESEELLHFTLTAIKNRQLQRHVLCGERRHNSNRKRASRLNDASNVTPMVIQPEASLGTLVGLVVIKSHASADKPQMNVPSTIPQSGTEPAANGPPESFYSQFVPQAARFPVLEASFEPFQSNARTHEVEATINVNVPVQLVDADANQLLSELFGTPDPVPQAEWDVVR
ncbi:hypothetical protein M408DRAFT_6173 [Serendipita vermifera MAFF 305830]|uniref:Uncharacterized protein n=1 Tax=Serendipita vermifera MAFF 305830 TaxID=933852 RepID=A0A0C2X391_SERVB|nr:hypothetical protein M408DRAFT_6173 [Serendipita vermifera MAFF 305830]